MARPLRQMPYQTAGDFLLTFPEAKSVGNYRRELNIDTAVARVSYTVGGVQFSREIFSSPVDQVIAIRLTANKPGQINFTTGMRTPQNASVRAEGKDTLVLRGVNGAARGIAGALKFQVRARVAPKGGRSKRLTPQSRSAGQTKLCC